MDSFVSNTTLPECKKSTIPKLIVRKWERKIIRNSYVVASKCVALNLQFYAYQINLNSL